MHTALCRSAFAIVLLCLLACASPNVFGPLVAAQDLYPPVDKKFCVYDGGLVTELKGTVYGANGSDLFINPDPNCLYMLIEGNRRRPQVGEDGYAEYSAWVSPTSTIPVMKLETYGVGAWGDQGGSQGPTPPMVNDNGTVRPVKAGDHVRVTGQYVTDNAHTMFYVYCTDSFSYMRGMYKACFAHSELHPYIHSEVELIRPSADNINTEVHTVAAPIYTQYYSSTYGWNKLWDVAGKLVNDSMESTVSGEWTIDAPPIPAGGVPGITHFLKLDETLVRGVLSAHSVTQVANGFKVQVSVTGSDVTKPNVFQGKYSAYWVPVKPEVIKAGDWVGRYGYGPDPRRRTLVGWLAEWCNIAYHATEQPELVCNFPWETQAPPEKDSVNRALSRPTTGKAVGAGLRDLELEVGQLFRGGRTQKSFEDSLNRIAKVIETVPTSTYFDGNAKTSIVGALKGAQESDLNLAKSLIDTMNAMELDLRVPSIQPVEVKPGELSQVRFFL